MQIRVLLTLISLFSLITLDATHGAKILHIFPIRCKSSFLFHQKLIEILLNNGHDVTAVSKFPQKERILNYTDIDVSENLHSMADANPRGAFESLYIPYNDQLRNCEKAYQNSKMKHLLTQKFDLVLIEIAATKCFVPLAFAFEAPVIGVVAGAVSFYDFDGFIGNAGNPSYVPAMMSGLSPKMNFFQRFSNTYYFCLHWLFRVYYTVKGNGVAQRYVTDTPTIGQLFNNVSLIFYNSHFTFLPQSLAPNTIEIAGIHMKKPKPLPLEIRQFVDRATNGVIFVSSFPKEIHDIFFRVFAQLPYHVLWRHDEPGEMKNVPKNVLVHQQLSRNDILAEKKTVLFISHCEIFSVYESIHYGVPILGIPVLYDQFTNAAITEHLGIGLKIDYENITEELLLSSINKILNEKRFSENIKTLSKKFKNRPLSPAETFMYWINYVIQFKGAPHLKTAAQELPFYKYLLIDVMLFVFLALYFTSHVVLFVFESVTKISFTKEKQN